MFFLKKIHQNNNNNNIYNFKEKKFKNNKTNACQIGPK